MNYTLNNGTKLNTFDLIWYDCPIKPIGWKKSGRIDGKTEYADEMFPGSELTISSETGRVYPIEITEIISEYRNHLVVRIDFVRDGEKNVTTIAEIDICALNEMVS